MSRFCHHAVHPLRDIFTAVVSSMSSSSIRGCCATPSSSSSLHDPLFSSRPSSRVNSSPPFVLSVSSLPIVAFLAQRVVARRFRQYFEHLQTRSGTDFGTQDHLYYSYYFLSTLPSRDESPPVRRRRVRRVSNILSHLVHDFASRAMEEFFRCRGGGGGLLLVLKIGRTMILPFWLRVFVVIHLLLLLLALKKVALIISNSVVVVVVSIIRRGGTAAPRTVIIIIISSRMTSLLLRLK